MSLHPEHQVAPDATPLGLERAALVDQYNLTRYEPNEDHVVGCGGETAGEGRQGSRRGAGRDRDHDAPKNCWPSDHGVWEPRQPQNG